MDNFFGLASLIFFLVSIYNLSRAIGWSRTIAGLMAIGIILIPTGLILLTLVVPVPAGFAEVLGGLSMLGAFVVLFALSKSVSNKVKR